MNYINKLEHQIEDYASRNRALQGSIKPLENRIEQLEAIIRHCTEAMVAIKDEYGALYRGLPLHEAVQNLTDSYRDLSQEVKDLQQRNHYLTRQVDFTADAVVSLGHALEAPPFTTARIPRPPRPRTEQP